ncbi:MAG TPA: hypothetical protein VLY85_00130 [Thermoplasmata archaeon]|nr:hypothetical protein [Thermoplasmata archaeon]
MPTTLYLVPSTKRTELDAVLGDDIVSRQSRKVREAPAMGGPAGELYVMIEGSAESIGRADELLKPLGKKVAAAEADSLVRRFHEEDEAASAGMGLFFTE